MEDIAKKRADASLVTKLFTISIILEFSRFFIVGNREDFGVNITISRVFQISVIFFLFAQFFYSKRRILDLKIPEQLVKMVTILFIYIVMIWLFFYSISIFDYLSPIRPSFFSHMDSQALSSIYSRSYVELIIFIFYFFYFSLLPLYILNDDIQMEYFLKTTLAVFTFFIFIGWVDFFLSIFGIELIARHLNDGVHVGIRWHSFFGEPRDAFSALIFTGFILCLQNLKHSKSLWSNYRMLLIVLSAVFTFSLSGIIGIAISIILIMMIFLVYGISFGRLILFLGLVLLLVFAVLVLLSQSDRLGEYFDAGIILTEIFFNSEPVYIDGVLSGQAPNVIPIWYRIYEFNQGTFLPLIFGTGLGSSAIINSFYIGEDGLLNPHTQITRIIFEFGIIGSILFVFTFFWPINSYIKKINLDDSNRKTIFILFCWVMGSFLAHRSSLAYIFLGITTAFLFLSYKRDAK